MKLRQLLLASIFLGVAAPALAQTITINGSGTPGQTVSGPTMAIVAAGGSGDKTDAIYVCSPSGGCAPANGWDYDYLNGTKTETQSPPYPTGGSFNLNVPTAAGNYNVTWYQSDTNTNITSLTFTVPAAAPTPINIIYSPTYGVVADTSASGSVVGGFTVQMSDSSTFNGTDSLLTGSDALCVAPSSGNGNLTLSRALTSADAASQHTCKLQVSENGVNKEVDFQFNVEKAVEFSDTSNILPGLINGQVLGVANGAFAMIPGGGGAAANTIWNGTGAPAASLGANGDFYIDTAAHAIYGPKASGAWPSSSVSLVGPTGPTGAQGPMGQNAGQSGLFTPTSSTMACSQGQSGFDATYIYACLSTNHWGRLGGGQTSWQTTGW